MEISNQGLSKWRAGIKKWNILIKLRLNIRFLTKIFLGINEKIMIYKWGFVGEGCVN